MDYYTGVYATVKGAKNVVTNSDEYLELVNPVVDKIENIKQDGEVKGNRVRVKIVKNKVAPPFREAEFDIVYGKGTSKEGNVLDIGVNLGIVEKAGAWFSYNGTRIGQGRENVKQYLVEHPDVCAEIEKKIRENYAQAFDKSLSDELVNATDDDE